MSSVPEPEMMNAAVYRGPQSIETDRVPVPEIGPEDILVDVVACGICGSDIHSYKLGMYVDPDQVMGHEFVGRVSEVGAEVKDITVGQRVTGFIIGFCGECFWCKRGEYGLCPDVFHLGLGYGKPGAFAEKVRIERAVLGVNVYDVPDSIDDMSAATIEPVAVAAGAMALSEMKPGDKVVVLGAGLIGNVCAQIAKAKGAEKVVITDINPLRLQAALDAGVDAAFDASKGDALEWVKEQIGVGRYAFNEGAMADVVIEVSGAPSAVTDSFEMVRSGGTIVYVGLPEKPALVDTTKIVHKRPRIVGSLAGDFAGAIEYLASGQVKTGQLVDRVRDFADIAEAFDDSINDRDIMKTVITMGDK